MTLAPLEGYTVGVTAHRRWEEQAELLRHKGARVIHGAMIHTEPFDDTDALLACTDALIAEPPDVVVLTTGIGVRAWFAAIDAAGRTDRLLTALSRTEVVARGPKALGAAATVGLEVAWAASGEVGREIVDHFAAAGVSGRRIAVQRDGGRPELADALRALAADVIDVPVYRWTVPDDEAAAQRLIDGLCAGELDAITFTSAPAVVNLMTLARARCDAVRGMLAGPTVVACVGPVTAEAARAAGAPDPIAPRRGRLGAMVQALARRLGEDCHHWRTATGDVVIQGAVVAMAGERVALSARERRALAQLTAHHGGVVSKRDLLTAAGSPDAHEHAAEVLVGRLRRRLGAAAEAIEVVPRRGYRWHATPV